MALDGGTRVQDSRRPAARAPGHKRWKLSHGHPQARPAFTIITNKKGEGAAPSRPDASTHTAHLTLSQGGTLSPAEKGQGAPGSGDLQNGLQVTPEAGMLFTPLHGNHKSQGKALSCSLNAALQFPIRDRGQRTRVQHDLLTTCRMGMYSEGRSAVLVPSRGPQTHLGGRLGTQGHAGYERFSLTRNSLETRLLEACTTL